MAFFASVNGEITPAAEARVSVLDNGFTFGDGVYETLRTYGGRPFHLDRHLTRLRASAAMLGITIPAADETLAGDLDRLLERAANPESYIRIIVSRGVGEISYRFDRIKGPTVVMAARAYEPFPDAQYRDGIPVIISSVRRNSPRALDPAMKSCNLINNILAVREAQAKKAAEPLMLNERGDVAEGASANVFIVADGALVTPPLNDGILPGVTRAVVLELAAKLGMPAVQRSIRVAILLAADEAFITSTLKEVMPIATVDGRAIGGGKPGPVTKKLLEAYRHYAARAGAAPSSSRG
jgi:branched-chain amino acid aminotransferase